MAFHPVAVAGFQGPLDLLLDLIEKERLDISTVSLADVTDQYLERLHRMEEMPPEHLAQFLAVAARLLLLKSRRLLPQFALTPEEEESVETLAQQLREYQTFRVAARTLRQLWDAPVFLASRRGFLGVARAFTPPPEKDVARVFLAPIRRVVAGLPALSVTREEAIARVVSLEERMRDLRERIRAASIASFQRAVGEGAKKLDVIVSFLALLELVKRRLVRAEQREAFHDILIRKHPAA